MKARPYTLLIHPFFLINLALLLLNDLYLKYAFHNGFTGKLSDFAGLFVFTIFLFTFSPSYKKSIIVICVLLFCWWKSPLSSSFIHFANDHLTLPLHRVVDYTDLFALLVLPLAYRVKPPAYSLCFIRSAAIYIVGIISLFSFCATTMAPRHMMYHPYRHNEIYFNESFNSRFSEREIIDILDPQNLGYRKDSVRFYQVTETEDFYQRVNWHDSAVIWVPVTHNVDTTLFVKKRDRDFYILSWYVLEGDTLDNLEFRVYQDETKRKPTTIQIRSFQTRNPALYANFLDDKIRRRYKKHFKRVFSK